MAAAGTSKRALVDCVLQATLTERKLRKLTARFDFQRGGRTVFSTTGYSARQCGGATPMRQGGRSAW